MSQGKITLIGAGLVGSLLAIFLAKRGFAVEIFERRPDMRKQTISAGRSINLALSFRGINALKILGIDKSILQMAIPMPGRMVHSSEGALSFQAYGKDNSECRYSISRADLNVFLINKAEKTGLVNIEFNKKLVDVDLENKTIKLQDEISHEIYNLPFNHLIGADGSASQARKALANEPGFKNSEQELPYGYKELLLPAGNSGEFQLEKNALHIWPRGTYMLIALPNFDGSFTCTLFLPLKGENSFEQLNTSQSIEAFFATQFSDAVKLFPNLSQMFFTNPVGHMVTVKCAPWNHKGDMLLLGDAAHSIVPFFGEGMNCGFEDCVVFDQCLAEYGDMGDTNWEKTFSKLFQLRYKNTDAIADMAIENFIEMRDKLGDPQFQLQKQVEKLLQEKFPNTYISRYSLVSFGLTPYEKAFQAGLITTEILSELCQGLAKPEQIDLGKAEKLIAEKLFPIVKDEIVVR
jgi:kynurenine 3-monooxygenase